MSGFLCRLFGLLLSGLLSTNAFGVIHTPVFKVKDTNSTQGVTTLAIEKAHLELKLRKLKTAIENRKITGNQVDQILDKIHHLQNQLRGER